MNRPITNTAAPDLPQRYYLDHFNEFIAVIESRYQQVLEPEHIQWIEYFKNLDMDAACLYLRMLNRRGQIFAISKFRYREIQDIPTQIELLKQVGFIRSLQSMDFPDWLNIITRPVLLDLIEQQCSSGTYGRSWSKAKMVEFSTVQLQPTHSSTLLAMEDFVMQCHQDTVAYLLFLYFGKFEQDLSRFTLRDLGVVQSSRFNNNTQARFSDKETALNVWFYSKKKAMVSNIDANQCLGWAKSVESWPETCDERSQLERQKVLYRLGEKLEKYGDTDMAVETYDKAESWPASERLIRIVYRRGEQERAATLLESIIDDPFCEEEMLFAEDFYQRKFNKKRTSLVTDILRQSTIIKLDESLRNSPEQGALQYFRTRGAQAFYAENHFWKRLFGLLFWPLLFENHEAKIYNEFDRKPADLDTGGFYQRFAQSIEKLLDRLSDTEWLLAQLLSTVTKEYGNPNGIFIWRPDMLDPICAFIQVAPALSVATIMRRMAKDYSGNHSGYPDLLVIENKEVQFIEIKAEGDQLRRNQLKQLVALEQAGFAVEINRVEWTVDPQQSYVVVDIETTGRRAAGQRITEIAAVKIVNNEIVDQWESLLNPCRSIPTVITDLTGITNEMVQDAPLFSDIAEDFATFCRGSVFVAHNVRFDYSFISDEYRRLQKSFELPTLCTCVEMRKWYPGGNSYSLKNLCERYQIDLSSHHRAMCDALAATELLKMINSKRM